MRDSLIAQNTRKSVSFAKFKASTLEDDGGDPPKDDGQEVPIEQKKLCIQRARGVFERALNYFRNTAPELKEERAMLLEEWLHMERGLYGPAGFEEYIDYVFPEENQSHPIFRSYKKALQWKKQRMDEQD